MPPAQLLNQPKHNQKIRLRGLWRFHKSGIKPGLPSKKQYITKKEFCQASWNVEVAGFAPAEPWIVSPVLHSSTPTLNSVYQTNKS